MAKRPLSVLSPGEQLEFNQSIVSSETDPGAIWDTLDAKDLDSRRAALQRALLQEDQDKGGEGFLDKAKSFAGSKIRSLFRGLDAPRAAAVAGAVELGEGLKDDDNLIRKFANANPELGLEIADKGMSVDRLKENFNRRVGVGDVLTEYDSTSGLPLNVRRALGFTGDVAVDPLNFIGFGTSRAAKAALGEVAEKGSKEAAEAFARDGVEAADTILARQADEAAKQAAEEAYQAARLPTQAGSTAPIDPLSPVSRLLDPAQAYGNAPVDLSGLTGLDLERAIPTNVSLGGIQSRPLDLTDLSKNFTDQAAYKDALARGAIDSADDYSRLAPSIKAITPEPLPVPTINSILGDVAPSDKAITKAITAVNRTGKGGVRYAGRTIIPGEVVAGWVPDSVRAAEEAWKGSKLGLEMRKALIPFTEVRDKFGDAVAAAMPGIGHRKNAIIRTANVAFDETLQPFKKLVKNMDETTRGQIFAAMDVGQDVSVDDAFDLLMSEGMEESAQLLRTLSDASGETYDRMISAGYLEENLLPRDEYIRHALTDEGKELFDIVDARLPEDLGGTTTGRLHDRKLGGTVTEKNTALGQYLTNGTAYVDDPVKLVKASWVHAAEVGGNKLAYDSLADLQKRVGRTLVTDVPTKGFTEVGPDMFIDQDIYSALFKLQKKHTQSSIVRSWDAFNGLMKRHILFSPISFGPYFSQNMATGVAINATDGVAPGLYRKMIKLHKAVKAGLNEAGEDGLDDYLRRVVGPDDAKLARELRDADIWDAGHAIYDDIASGDPLKMDDTLLQRLSRLGTNNTTKINSWGEEMLRGTSYANLRAQGASVDRSISHVLNRHIDYSSLGKTAFERDIINRFVFFPTWLIRAPAAILRAYATKPGLLMAQARLEMGTQWYDRETNDYDELLGPRLSGPLSFLTGAGAEGFDFIQNPLDTLNPVIKGLADPDERNARDMIAPLSLIMGGEYGVEGDIPGRQDGLDPDVVGRPGRLQGILADPLRRDNYIASMFGVRTGVDRAQIRDDVRFGEEVAERLAVGDDPTPSQTLTILAKEKGVEDATSLNTGELTRLLIDEDLMTKKQISRILAGD